MEKRPKPIAPKTEIFRLKRRPRRSTKAEEKEDTLTRSNPREKGVSRERGSQKWFLEKVGERKKSKKWVEITQRITHIRMARSSGEHDAWAPRTKLWTRSSAIRPARAPRHRNKALPLERENQSARAQISTSQNLHPGSTTRSSANRPARA